MATSPEPMEMASISEIISHIERLLYSAWCETGYGQLIIENHRIQHGHVRVVLRGSTHYKYVVSSDLIQLLRDSRQ